MKRLLGAAARQTDPPEAAGRPVTVDRSETCAGVEDGEDVGDRCAPGDGAGEGSDGDGSDRDDPGCDDPGSDDPGSDDPGSDDPGSDDLGSDDPGSDDPGSDDREDVPMDEADGGASTDLVSGGLRPRDSDAELGTDGSLGPGAEVVDVGPAAALDADVALDMKAAVRADGALGADGDVEAADAATGAAEGRVPAWLSDVRSAGAFARSRGVEPESWAFAPPDVDVDASRLLRRTVAVCCGIDDGLGDDVAGVAPIGRDVEDPVGGSVAACEPPVRPARAATIAVSGNRPAAATSENRRTRATSDTSPATMPPGVQDRSFATAWAACGSPRRGRLATTSLGCASSLAGVRFATLAHQCGGATAASARECTLAGQDGLSDRRTTAGRATEEANI
jgi:hypothetical protein